MIQLLLFFSLLCSYCYASVPREVTEMRDPKTNRKVLFWGDTHLSSNKMLNDAYAHFFKYFKKEEQEIPYNIFNFFNKPTPPKESLFFLYETGDLAMYQYEEAKKLLAQSRGSGLLYYLAFLSHNSIHTLRTRNDVPVYLYGVDIRPPIPWFKTIQKVENPSADFNRTLMFYSNEFEKILTDLQNGIDHLSNEEEKKLCLELYEPIRLVFSNVINVLKNIHCDCGVDLSHLKFNDVMNHCRQYNDKQHNEILINLLFFVGPETLLDSWMLTKYLLFNETHLFKVIDICLDHLFNLDYLVKILTFKTNGIVYAGLMHTRNLVKYLEMLGWEKTILHKFQKKPLCMHDIAYYSDYLLFQIDHDDYASAELYDENEVGCYTSAGEECYERVLSL